jgi:hypothetical protein
VRALASGSGSGKIATSYSVAVLPGV